MSIANVSEIYPLYDSVVVSQRFWGNEENVKGWFGGSANKPWERPMERFAATPVHLFFKTRTEGSADLAYCNLQSAETMDFAYRCYSIGVRFWGPVSRFESSPSYTGEAASGAGMPPWGDIVVDDPAMVQSCIGSLWMGALPMHCSFEFKIEQDVICEGPCMVFPPGHGMVASGASWSDPVTPVVNANPTQAGDDAIIQHPQMINVINQGNPLIGNRFNFVDVNGNPMPIEIPRQALMEARITLSPYAQYLLNGVIGPLYYLFNRRCPAEWLYGTVAGTDTNTWFGTRYGITVSMYGERLVQQRGQYHAPGAIMR